VPLSFERKPKRVDGDFYRKLSSEIPGIIARLISLSEDEIREKIESHRDGNTAKGVLHDTNHLVAFISDRLEASDDGGGILVGELSRDAITRTIINSTVHLYPAYVAWFEADNGGSRILGKRGFAQKIAAACQMRGIEGVKVSQAWDAEGTDRGKVSVTGLRMI